MFANLLYKLDAADRDRCCVESFESEHRSDSVFDSAMILLHNIIQVLAGSYSNTMRHRSCRLQFGDGPMRSRVSIQRDDAWCRVALHRFVEKAFGRGNIASFAQQEVDRSTLLVHCSIQIRPAPLHLYIGLVAAP